MIISLEKLGATTVAEADLIMRSTPLGLEVVVDGKSVGKTPIELPLAVGAHTLALRQGGTEVWRHQLMAQANVDHEFNPSMAEDKQRERRARASQPPAPRPDPPPAKLPEPKTVVEDPKPPEAKEQPVAPKDPPVTQVTPPVKEPTPPPIPPPPPPKPIAIPQTGPITVAPTAVTRIAGETPTVGMSKRAEVPAVIAAKVCITEHGTVSGVTILSKLERHTASDLASTLRTWRYAPYKQAGVAVQACFVVSFRVK
jgi:hypothetical protein